MVHRETIGLAWKAAEASAEAELPASNPMLSLLPPNGANALLCYFPEVLRKQKPRERELEGIFPTSLSNNPFF